MTTDVSIGGLLQGSKDRLSGLIKLPSADLPRHLPSPRFVGDRLRWELRRVKYFYAFALIGWGIFIGME